MSLNRLLFHAVVLSFLFLPMLALADDINGLVLVSRKPHLYDYTLGDQVLVYRGKNGKYVAGTREFFQDPSFDANRLSGGYVIYDTPQEALYDYSITEGCGLVNYQTLTCYTAVGNSKPGNLNGGEQNSNSTNTSSGSSTTPKPTTTTTSSTTSSSTTTETRTETTTTTTGGSGSSGNSSNSGSATTSSGNSGSGNSNSTPSTPSGSNSAPSGSSSSNSNPTPSTSNPSNSGSSRPKTASQKALEEALNAWADRWAIAFSSLNRQGESIKQNYAYSLRNCLIYYGAGTKSHAECSDNATKEYNEAMADLRERISKAQSQMAKEKSELGKSTPNTPGSVDAPNAATNPDTQVGAKADVSSGGSGTSDNSDTGSDNGSTTGTSDGSSGGSGSSGSNTGSSSGAGGSGSGTGDVTNNYTTTTTNNYNTTTNNITNNYHSNMGDNGGTFSVVGGGDQPTTVQTQPQSKDYTEALNRINSTLDKYLAQANANANQGKGENEKDNKDNTQSTSTGTGTGNKGSETGKEGGADTGGKDGNADGNNQKNETDSQSEYCKKNPKSLQCATADYEATGDINSIGNGIDEIKRSLPRKEIGKDFKIIQYLSGKGKVCPKPLSVTLPYFGNKFTLSFEPLCDFLLKSRPLVIMLATVITMLMIAKNIK